MTFDLLTSKVVSDSLVTWATSVPILVFLGLSVLDLGPMYATDRQTDVRQRHRLMLPRGRGHNKLLLRRAAGVARSSAPEALMNIRLPLCTAARLFSLQNRPE